MEKQNAKILNKLFVQQKISTIWIAIAKWLQTVTIKTVAISERQVKKERELFTQLYGEEPTVTNIEVLEAETES